MLLVRAYIVCSDLKKHHFANFIIFVFYFKFCDCECEKVMEKLERVSSAILDLFSCSVKHYCMTAWKIAKFTIT